MLNENPSGSGPKPHAIKWGIHEVTPGAIALTAIIVSIFLFCRNTFSLCSLNTIPQAHFFLSPDTDFGKMGNASGIMYSKSFQVYKNMLKKDPSSGIWGRIFLEYNTYLFSTLPTFTNSPVFDNGNYTLELEEFMNRLEEDAAQDIAGSSSAALLVSTGCFPPSPPAPPISSFQSEHCVLISVSSTSNISHTIAVASSILNVVLSGPTPPSTKPATKEPPPLSDPKPT